MGFKKAYTLILFLMLVFPGTSLADVSTGGDITNFDIQPRTVNANQSIRITLKFTVYGGSPSAFMEYCEVSSSRSREVRWSVFERLPNGQDRGISNGSGRVVYDPYVQPYPPYHDASYDVSFNTTLLDRAGSRTLYSRLICVTNTGLSAMTTSGGIVIAQNAAPAGPGPVGPRINPGSSLSFSNPLQSQTIWDLFNGIIGFALKIGLPIAVVIIVYSGILFMFSRGNPGMITKARTILMWAVVGLAVLLIGKGFLTLIQSILDLANR